MTTTQATATRDPFAALDTFGADTDAMAERFAAAATPVAKAEPVVHCLGGCGRRLTSAASLARGYGRHCWAKAHRRAATLGPEFSDRQVEAAIEAVEDGAVVPSGIPGTWLVVGSKGDATYATTVETCTCKAFVEAHRICWHRAAVALVAA